QVFEQHLFPQVALPFACGAATGGAGAARGEEVTAGTPLAGARGRRSAGATRGGRRGAGGAPNFLMGSDPPPAAGEHPQTCQKHHPDQDLQALHDAPRYSNLTATPAPIKPEATGSRQRTLPTGPFGSSMAGPEKAILLGCVLKRTSPVANTAN